MLSLERLEPRYALTAHCGVEVPPEPPPPPPPPPIETLPPPDPAPNGPGPLPPPPIVSINGTPGDDLIEIDTRPNQYAVTINGVTSAYNPAIVDAILVQPSAGRDRVVVRTGDDESAVLHVGSAEILGGRIDVAIQADLIDVFLGESVTGASG